MYKQFNGQTVNFNYTSIENIQHFVTLNSILYILIIDITIHITDIVILLFIP